MLRWNVFLSIRFRDIFPVGFYIFAVWWVGTNDVSFSLFFAIGCIYICLVLKCMYPDLSKSSWY